MKLAKGTAPTSDIPTLPQVGALPIQFENGELLILLLTSRETKRWIIPKGWPMKGKKNWAAAAQEAREEAGLVGTMYKKPLGSFVYFKRQTDHFDLCRVEVYALSVEKRLDAYREKSQREARWVSLEDASMLVEEPGLLELFRNLDVEFLRKHTLKKRKHPLFGL